MVKEIPLTQGKVALVDDEDYGLINKYKWFTRKTEYTCYAVRNSRVHETNKRRHILMHRMIMKVNQAEMIDHKNHNGLDNTRSNLRITNRSGNSRNALKQKIKSSVFKGVVWCRRSNKWITQIRINGGNKFLGYFSNEELAAKTYDKAAKKYFGEYSCLNFPEEN